MIERLEESVDYIRSRTQLRPRIGMILGSGLGTFVGRVQAVNSFTYDEIPNFEETSVEGHHGNLILGRIGKCEVAILQGRIHYYEGHNLEQVVFPARTLAMLGIEILVLTNSAGGLDPKMQPGHFMIIEDHINLMGNNPLMGPNLKQLGPRFPDMSQAYDLNLREKLETVLQEKSIPYHKGVYCAVSGPTYETPAEVRFLQLIGGNAVGMSTVPEVIAANHLGLRVVAFSCITNLAAGLGQKRLSHSEVTETAKIVENEFADILTAYLDRI